MIRLNQHSLAIVWLTAGFCLSPILSPATSTIHANTVNVSNNNLSPQEITNTQALASFANSTFMFDSYQQYQSNYQEMQKQVTDPELTNDFWKNPTSKASLNNIKNKHLKYKVLYVHIHLLKNNQYKLTVDLIPYRTTKAPTIHNGERFLSADFIVKGQPGHWTKFHNTQLTWKTYHENDYVNHYYRN